MAIPPWAVDALRRGVGGVLDKVPPEKFEQLKKRAGDLLAELPQTAARGVDSMMRGAKVGKDSIQRWTRRHTALVTPVVNASGCLCAPAIAGVPICDDAIDVAAEAFQSSSLNNAAAHDRLKRRLASCVGSNDFGVLVAATVDGACLAVANTNPMGGNFYFHRSQSQRLPSGTPIPDAFAVGVGLRAERKIVEVGSVDRVDALDSRQVIEPATLVAVDNGSESYDWYHSDPGATAKRPGMLRVVYLPVAAWNSPANGDSSPVQLPVVLQRLNGSADIVITSGDGSLGGPRCGLIVGDKQQLSAIEKSSIWPSLVADVAVQSAITVTLEILTSGQTDELPVHAMMHTSEENLRSRAERLATRIAAEPVVSACQITDNAATLTSAGNWSLPSRQLKLTHRDLSAGDWAARLLSEVPAMVVGIDEESIVVDLRWIQPSDDAALVATLVGHHLNV